MVNDIGLIVSDTVTESHKSNLLKSHSVKCSDLRMSKSRSLSPISKWWEFLTFAKIQFLITQPYQCDPIVGFVMFIDNKLKMVVFKIVVLWKHACFNHVLGGFYRPINVLLCLYGNAQQFNDFVLFLSWDIAMNQDVSVSVSTIFSL